MSTPPKGFSWLSDVFIHPLLGQCVRHEMTRLKGFLHAMRNIRNSCKTLREAWKFPQDFMFHHPSFPSVEYQQEVQLLPKELSLPRFRPDCFACSGEQALIALSRPARIFYDNGVSYRTLFDTPGPFWESCAISKASAGVRNDKDCVNALAAVHHSCQSCHIAIPNEDRSDFSQHIITVREEYVWIKYALFVYCLPKQYLLLLTGIGPDPDSKYCYGYRVTSYDLDVIRQKHEMDLSEFTEREIKLGFKPNDIILIPEGWVLFLGKENLMCCKANPFNGTSNAVIIPHVDFKASVHTEEDNIAVLYEHFTDKGYFDQIITISTRHALHISPSKSRSISKDLGLEQGLEVNLRTSMVYIPRDGTPFSGKLIVAVRNCCLTYLVEGQDIFPFNRVMKQREYCFGLEVCMWKRNDTWRYRFYFFGKNDLCEYNPHANDEEAAARAAHLQKLPVKWFAPGE